MRFWNENWSKLGLKLESIEIPEKPKRSPLSRTVWWSLGMDGNGSSTLISFIGNFPRVGQLPGSSNQNSIDWELEWRSGYCLMDTILGQARSVGSPRWLERRSIHRDQLQQNMLRHFAGKRNRKGSCENPFQRSFFQFKNYQVCLEWVHNHFVLKDWMQLVLSWCSLLISIPEQ